MILEQFPRQIGSRVKPILVNALNKLKNRIKPWQLSRIVFVLNEELCILSDVKRTLEVFGLEGRVMNLRSNRDRFWSKHVSNE